MASHTPLRPLRHARDTIDECLPGDEPYYELSSDKLDNKLHDAFSALVALVNADPRIELSCEEKGDVWYIILKLWEWCADDLKSSTEAPRCLAAIRQHTSDVLEAMDNDELSSKERSNKLAIYHKIGAAHAKAGQQEAAEAAYSKAQELCVRIMTDVKGTGVPEAQRIGVMTGCMALILDRLTNAWELRQMALASDLLSQATDLLQQATLPSQQRFHMGRQDILSSLKRGKKSQSTKEIDAESLLAFSHQLVTGHPDKEDDKSEEYERTVPLLQAQVLRLLSQALLLSGQPAHAYASVQSVRKLQEPPDDSPGLCLTAIEALIQLEQPDQAAAELLALVEHKDASADLCLEALSAIIQETRCGALKPAADVMMERFAEDASVPQVEVLRLLSQAYLLSGQASQVLACVEKVRELQNTPEDDPDLCLTAVKALVQLERQEEAEKELLELVLGRSASADQCLAALTAVIQGPRCSVPKSATQTLLDRFGDNAAACLGVFQALMGASGEEEGISREREAIAIKIIRYKHVPQLFLKADGSNSDQRKRLCMLLWKHASQLYNRADYKACINFYFGALMYAGPNAKATLDRQLRQMYQAMPEIFRSAEGVDIGNEADPSSDPTIVNTKARKALNKLLPLLKSEDPNLNFREALVKELLLASNGAASKQTLAWLWEEVMAAQAPCKRPEDEATVAANLIMMTAAGGENKQMETRHLPSIPAAEEYQCSKPSADSGGASTGNSLHQELARLFSQALQRIEVVGDKFYGGAGTKQWFAGASYNAALMAMNSKDASAAAEIFRACGIFHEAQPFTTPEYWKIRRETYMLGIKCTMEEYASQPERKSCLTEAHALHNKASAALEAAVRLPVDPKDLVKFRKALWMVELDLAMKESQYSQMVPLLERVKTEGIFTAEELLHISHVCLEITDIPHAPSAKAALSAALQLIRSHTVPLPYMDKLAEVVNELYQVSSDEEALALLTDVGAYMSSMETLSYPSSEMSWLITRAWERGSKFAQDDQHAQALAFLAAALELMDFCDDFRDTKEEKFNFFEGEVVRAAHKGL